MCSCNLVRVFLAVWMCVDVIDDGGRVRVVTFLVTRFPSSSVNCSSVTDSPGMFLASSP